MTIDPNRIPAEITGCPGLPADHGSPVFAAPWQAQIFAMVVALHERGVFPWAQFQSQLIAAINQAPLDEQGPEFYYRQWLQAAE
jgi:nitrile hydratase accessory protein